MPSLSQLSCLQIRNQLAKEMVQDLTGIPEENNSLMRETLLNSFALSLEHVVAHPVENAETPTTESSAEELPIISADLKETPTNPVEIPPSPETGDVPSSPPMEKEEAKEEKPSDDESSGMKDSS